MGTFQDVLQLGHNSLVRKLALIELCVFLTMAAFSVLIICGTHRRRCRGTVFKIVVWIAYILSTQLLTYTVGMMQTAQFRNKLFALWAILLLILHGCSDAFSAFSLEDNEQWAKYTMDVVILSITVGIFIAFYATTSHFKWAIGFLCFLNYKINERDQAFRLASKSYLAKKTKLIADFMVHEHELNIEDEDDQQDPRMYLSRYNYLVAGERDDVTMVTVQPPLYLHCLQVTDEVITIRKIWRCRGKLLSGDPGQKLKDICLSFALYKLLCRRFGGHDFEECTQEKTWNFVRYGLLSREEDYERAFRVIEVELSFLFDLFYTKLAIIFQEGQRVPRSRLVGGFFIIIGCLVAIILQKDYEPSHDYLNLFTAGGRVNIDNAVTLAVFFGICIMEIVQGSVIIISNWLKVKWICEYVKNESLQNYKYWVLFFKIICCETTSKPWERRLGQYSLLRSFNYEPNIFYHTLSWLTKGITDVPRKGQKENPSIELPSEVTKAVLLSLRNNGPRLSNGRVSLQKNQVENELSWACDLPTTHIIISWHIATSLCRIRLADGACTGDTANYLKVATALSDYCAYLVVFAPRLLPGHATYTDFIFDQVVYEARNLLDGCLSESEMYDRMMNWSEGVTDKEEATLIERGAFLAKQLIRRIEEGLRWKVLADFWVELMLFLAPSDDARAHADRLAQGGEFITHLWALLSHAGILKQDQTRATV